MPRQRDHLYLGIGGHVVAIDPATGQELWRNKLKASHVATVHVAGERLYGAAGGEVFALDPATGHILWRNKLRGLGLGIVAFPGTSDAVAGSVDEDRRRRSAAAG